MPTLDKILIAINTDPQLPNLSRASLHRVLLNLGFKFCKRGRNSMITDREDLILWRRKYIQSLSKYRNEGRTVYYLDETWINAGGVSSKVWEDTTVKSAKDAFLRGLSTGSSNPTGKGKRLIILHIGSKNGFVPDALLCFESKKNSSDYHDEMNGDTFKDWFQKILPTLDENCVIVMDNAPYHSMKEEKVPNMSWRKEEIQNWMLKKAANIKSKVDSRLNLDWTGFAHEDSTNLESSMRRALVTNLEPILIDSGIKAAFSLGYPRWAFNLQSSLNPSSALVFRAWELNSL
ncbi:uncharacterized protein LOC127285359 [Leptopilina boulardi]|uniref:uncharacterized protein LOC127285359 n=1 Tax=Leptopilina boulardi TaxID=63433 RepID=UPI0021F65605|nr:uncharacterized protein LOC127285359 [Leptopilina boulardi]